MVSPLYISVLGLMFSFPSCVLPFVMLGILWNLGAVMVLTGVITWVMLNSQQSGVEEPPLSNESRLYESQAGLPEQAGGKPTMRLSEDNLFATQLLFFRTYLRVVELEYPSNERTPPIHRNNGFVHATGIFALLALFLVYQKHQAHRVNHQHVQNPSLYFVACGIAVWCWILNHDSLDEYYMIDAVEMGLLLGIGYMLWGHFYKEEIPTLARKETPDNSSPSLKKEFLRDEVMPPSDMEIPSLPEGFLHGELVHPQPLPETCVSLETLRHHQSQLSLEGDVASVAPPGYPTNGEPCNEFGPCEEHGVRPLLPFSHWEPFHSCGKLYESRFPEVNSSKYPSKLPAEDPQRYYSEDQATDSHPDNSDDEIEDLLDDYSKGCSDTDDSDDWEREDIEHVTKRERLRSQYAPEPFSAIPYVTPSTPSHSCKETEARLQFLQAKTENFRRHLSRQAEEIEMELQRHLVEVDNFRYHTSQQTQVVIVVGHFGLHLSQQHLTDLKSFQHDLGLQAEQSEKGLQRDSVKLTNFRRLILQQTE
jgi:hypothetical protein